MHLPKTFLCLGLALLLGGLWGVFSMLFRSPLTVAMADRMQLLIVHPSENRRPPPYGGRRAGSP